MHPTKYVFRADLKKRLPKPVLKRNQCTFFPLPHSCTCIAEALCTWTFMNFDCHYSLYFSIWMWFLEFVKCTHFLPFFFPFSSVFFVVAYFAHTYAGHMYTTSYQCYKWCFNSAKWTKLFCIGLIIAYDKINVWDMCTYGTDHMYSNKDGWCTNNLMEIITLINNNKK